MAQPQTHDGDYTVTSLIASLKSIGILVDAIAQSAFDLSKGSGNDDAYHGLWRELHNLSMTLEGCLARLQSPSTSESAAIRRVPPILDSCKAMVESLTATGLGSLSLDAIIETKSKALWFQRTISNGSSWTDTQNGLLLYLSLLPAAPSRDFQALGVPPAEIRRWRSLRNKSHPRQGRRSPRSTLDTVSYWLTLLNADFNDREPEEFYREKIFIELRNQAVPEYSKAAAQWPRFAGQFWAILRPQVFSLFNSSKSFNFVQWVLEYARGTWPSIFGAQAASAEPIMDLTDSLCSGAISPLHVACALGLPSLCRDLLSSGSDINRSGPLGTPILCALRGCDVFEERFSGVWECPSDPTTYANQERVETILLLLDAGADCRFPSYTWLGRQASIIGPAFWASLATKDEAILRRVKEGGAALDTVLDEILQYPEVEAQCSQYKEFSSRLLTYLFDLYLDKDITLSGGETIAIQGVMQRSGLTFSCTSGEEQVEGISTQDLQTLTNEMMAISWAFGLRRLILDPRFDPNRSSNDYGDEDSLLHSAVAADALDVVDVLMSAGADLHAEGSQGRTPVMVVESTRMLEKLVFRYGAITRDIDQDGRTIWHYAAATNDMPLLTWLCDKDPWKADNIKAKTDMGRTPLAEAFLFIESLPSQPGAGHTLAPLAARKLLKECDDSSSLFCPVPLTHLAAAWGDLELIHGLEALGANFRQSDSNGRTALHYLNFAASVEVVESLQKLCAGAPVECDDGLTPAETIFNNFRPLLDDGHPVLSAHPSCRQPLSEDAYSLLLNAATMNFLDYRGECFWRRFCTDVIGANPIPTQTHRAKWISILHKSITTALKCIIRAGGLEDYEQENGKSAVMCFLGGTIKEMSISRALYERQPHRSWNVKYFYPFILTVLENSGSSVLQKFYSSSAAVELLYEAVSERKMDLVRHLSSAGVQIIGTSNDSSNLILPLEWAISFCPDREVIGELLKHVTGEQLTKRIYELYFALRIPRAHEAVEKLQMLLRKGMDPSYLPPGRRESVLGEAGLNGNAELATVLLDHGADARAGSRGSNAAICAVIGGAETILTDIIGRVGVDFPWTDVWESDHGDENILLTASRLPFDFVLKVLLQNGSYDLDKHVNDLVGGTTAIHKAAARGLMLNLHLLLDHGADLTVCDSRGRTPLHAACATKPDLHGPPPPEPTSELSLTGCVRFLAEKEPRAAAMKDEDGKTPLDLAVELGEEEYQAALKRHTGVREGDRQ